MMKTTTHFEQVPLDEVIQMMEAQLRQSVLEEIRSAGDEPLKITNVLPAGTRKKNGGKS